MPRFAHDCPHEHLRHRPIVDRRNEVGPGASQFRRAIEALGLLTTSGVLHRLGSQSRNRRYEAIALFELVITFGQDVASGHIDR